MTNLLRSQSKFLRYKWPFNNDHLSTKAKRGGQFHRFDSIWHTSGPSRLQKVMCRGLSINDVKQFLIKFNTPPPIVTLFSTKAYALDTTSFLPVSTKGSRNQKDEQRKMGLKFFNFRATLLLMEIWLQKNIYTQSYNKLLGIRIPYNIYKK